MKVQQYRVTATVHAALWDGDIKTMLEFPTPHPEFIVEPHSLELRLWGTQGYQEVKPGKGYIIRGISGLFFVMGVDAFAKTYQLATSQNYSYE